MKGSVITSDGVSLAYSMEGTATADVLMLSNSLGTDRRLWDQQMPALGQRFRVLRYDTRGHGESAAPDGDYALERLGMDALELLDALQIVQASFAGISLGGMTAQWLRQNAPERCRSVALCNTSSYMGPPESWDSRISAVQANGMAAIVESVLSRWFTPDFLRGQPEPVTLARNMLLGTAPRGYAGCCAAIRDMDMRSFGPGRSVPTLIIAGSMDPATPPSHAALLHSKIPDARVVTLPAAHLSNLEQPEAFTGALLAFFTHEA
jgi:3-oxoadipate enol-lactonase